MFGMASFYTSHKEGRGLPRAQLGAWAMCSCSLNLETTGAALNAETPTNKGWP